MNVDLDTKTVEFYDQENLCVHELEALVSLLNNGLLAEPHVQVAKVEYPLVAYIQSYSRKGMFYQLKLEAENKLWTCTCPDYMNRGFDDKGRQNGHECKHIRRHIYTM